MNIAVHAPIALRKHTNIAAGITRNKYNPPTLITIGTTVFPPPRIPPLKVIVNARPGSLRPANIRYMLANSATLLKGENGSTKYHEITATSTPRKAIRIVAILAASHTIFLASSTLPKPYSLPYKS